MANIHPARFGGGREIRTHEGRKPLPVFKTGAFNRSASPPGFLLFDEAAHFEPRCASCPAERLITYAVRPIIGCFVNAHAFQAQVVAVGVLVSEIENIEGDLSKIFCSGHDIENDGAVIGQSRQKIAHQFIVTVCQEGMIPLVHQLLIGDTLHIRKIHHHPLFGFAFSRDDVAGQRDFNGVAMSVQVLALAVVVGDAMSGIEFQAAGDEHGGGVQLGCGDYNIAQWHS